MGQASPGCDDTPFRRGVIGIVVFISLAHAIVKVHPAEAGTKEATLPPSAGPVPVSASEAQPTRAWAKFCDEHPAECTIDPAEPEVITLTAEGWATLLAVNDKVNTTIVPLPDRDHWDVEDRWDYPDDGFGDCEDIQLLKRRLLAQAGLPRRALRMTVVLDELHAGHAVLMARTDRGDFILDNKASTVLPWYETGYEFIKREGAEGLAWVALIGSGRAPVVTANP
jgi:predicted transglutaminase-like cysteine proteinase